MMLIVVSVSRFGSFDINLIPEIRAPLTRRCRFRMAGGGRLSRRVTRTGASGLAHGAL